MVRLESQAIVPMIEEIVEIEGNGKRAMIRCGRSKRHGKLTSGKAPWKIDFRQLAVLDADFLIAEARKIPL